MNGHPVDLETLVNEHLAGESPRVPSQLKNDFDRAVAGHRALEELFDETAIAEAAEELLREPPALGDDYVIQRELGRGGMGVVYLVRQKSLGRLVALKVLRPGQQTFGPLVTRFLGEARHLANLRHPNIVAIHEIGDAQGEPYFTMDYVEGEPLSARLRRGPLPPSQAVEILKQMAAAIQYAHRQGIIHRDLKPANVLLDAAGRVFVTDFGLARDIKNAPQLTATGELLGTPQYMAPEQARGQTQLIGEATDIHALGMILYEMLTGEPPYASSSPADILVRLLNEEPPSPRSRDRRIPRDLETICLKMLAKSPDARYANVSALLEDLRRYEAGEPLLARRSRWYTRAWRWSMRHRKTALAMASAVVVTAAVILAAAPGMFDKSYEELVAWGDEELAGGHPEMAAQVYSRALQRADDATRPELVGRIVRTCRELDDPKAAVDLALGVVEFAPDTSFGKHDYLVAQALAARVRATSPGGAISIFQQAPHKDLKLLKSRLELALSGKLEPKQRAEADRTLEVVNLALGQDRSWMRVDDSHLPRLPTGSAVELRAMSDDAAEPLWNRAKAALALGKQLETDGDTKAALAAYRQALDRFRRVYPMVGGVKASSGATPSRVGAPDAEECKLVQDAVAAVHRLDADAPERPWGVVEFRVEGVELPPSVGIELKLLLCDPEIKEPYAGLAYNLPTLVPLRQDAPVRLQVLDGRYRLEHVGRETRADDGAERFSRLLQVDVANWPKTIEVKGGVLRLPPVQLRMAREIDLLSPASGERLDLREAELRWTAVPGAARYNLQLSYRSETPQPTTSYFLFPQTAVPSFRFTQLSAAERRVLRENLPAGRTGGWGIDAYDANGKRIGESLEERLFLVTTTLDEE